MNIRKQLKVGKKMRGVTSSIRPKKLKGLRVARRIKAIRKMNVAKRLRRSFTRAATATGTASTNTARMLPVIPTTTTTSTSGKWIAIVKKKISSSRPKFPHYYNNKGRNGSTNNTSKNNMIIIHNNTSITGNEELDNRASCVDEGKDINPLKLKEDDDHVASVDSAAPLPPDLHQLASGKEDNKEDNNEEEELEIVRLRGEEKAAIHIQSVFRGHLARRACRTLKSLARLQAMVRGVCVRRQARIALDCMNALVRLQFRVRTRQLLPSSPNNDAVTIDHPSLD